MLQVSRVSRVILIVGLLISGVSICTYGQELIAFKCKNGKWGFKDKKTDNEVISCMYENASRRNFHNGLAAVKFSGKWGYIDKTNKTVIPFKYDWVSYIRDYSAIAVKLNGKHGIIDIADNVVLPIEYGIIAIYEYENYVYAKNIIDQKEANGDYDAIFVQIGHVSAEQIEREKAITASLEREKIEEEKINTERIETERLAEAKAEAEPLSSAKAETERAEAVIREPPKISIIDPINRSIVESEQVKIVYDVSETTPTLVRISVDGRPVQLITDAQLGQNTVMVDVPNKDFNITIIAQNEFAASVPATVNLIRNVHVFKPSLYILAIGVSNYDNRELRLLFPAKDASDFTQALIRQAGLLYESVDVKLLTDRRATAENIRDGLSWLQTETTNRDVAMLYIAGHGINDNIGDFFFMPVNADINRINATCVSYVDIKRTISAVAGKLIVFMDACHSGNVLGNTQQRAAGIIQAVSELTGAENGPVVFTSSTGRQFSLESPEWNNGAFTKALVEGLSGKADLLGNKTITIKSLDYYIATRVKELTSGRQAPTTIIPLSIPDFPIAVVAD